MNVSIRIHSRQTANGESEAIEQTAEGVYVFGEALSTLRYEEDPSGGMEGTVSTFALEPGAVTLTREGQIACRMVFQPGKRHRFTYSTPYGSHDLGLFTRRLDVRLSENGGTVELGYDLEAEGVTLGSTELRLAFGQS